LIQKTSDPIKNHLLNSGSGFQYIEQLAVHKNFRRNGIGKQLLEKIILKSTHFKVYGTVSHNPKFNKPSVELLIKIGFTFKDQITFNGLTFGVYYKHLSRKYV